MAVVTHGSDPGITKYVTRTIALNTASTTTDVLDFRNYRGGSILIPTGTTTLTFYAASSSGATSYALYDASATAVSMTVVADRWYELPIACFGCGYLVIASNATGTATVMLKS